MSPYLGQRPPDKLPRTIKVWACPVCGYWRQDRATAVHSHFVGRGSDEVHQLEEVDYTLADYE